MADQFVIRLELDDAEKLGDSLVKSLFSLDRLLIGIRPGGVNGALQFLRSNFAKCTIYVDVTQLEDLAELPSLLNQGASKAFVSSGQLKSIVQAGLSVESNRLVVSLDEAFLSSKEDPKNDVAALLLGEGPQSFSGAGISLPSGIEGGEKLESLAKTQGTKSFGQVYTPINSTESYSSAISKAIVPIVPATSLAQDDKAKATGKFSFGDLFAALVQSDRPDGLWSTVVVNEHGVCLGLVFSNRESLEASLATGRGVYKSRKRPGLWHKGDTSGDIQELVKVGLDCDRDSLIFTVRQKGDGFCHLKTATCFGSLSGLCKLEQTLVQRKASAPAGSYTSKLFNDNKLLQAKIIEEANELCQAESKEDVAAEAADLFYFALTKCVAAGVSLEDVEKNLDLKSLKISRRKGDAKPEYAEQVGLTDRTKIVQDSNGVKDKEELVKEAASVPKSKDDDAGIKDGKIQMKRLVTAETDIAVIKDALKRPSQRGTEEIMKIVKPIIERVRDEGDTALLEYTHKFDKATSLKSPVLEAPFPEELMQLPPETIKAIDTSFENIRKFHAAQKETKPLEVETMPGVVCSRFVRPIEKVGLYVPGGTAVLPSSALMLGVPAMVAGCKNIVLATPPRADGTITPEVVYAAHKVGAECIVLAGGAQAIAAMAYGTESITKVDKILGPGNQFVTAGKMLVSNDTTASVSIDMPAGPSEVMVIADKTADPAFVASDLLSQAEHGVDSQVMLIAIDLAEEELAAIEDELHRQASALPRVDIVRGAIAHSVTLVVEDVREALLFSNTYAPEHLILQIADAAAVVPQVENAGSVFIGMWTPESVGDYSAGVNHSLPTYGYAKQYSGVNLASFTKHITSSNLTPEGLRNVGGAVMQLAKVEELEAHRRAVEIRLEAMDKTSN